jgi:protein TonB
MKITPLFFLLILTVTARAQQKESFYVFDADWKPTKIDSAHFLLRVHQVNDTCWQWDYYNFTGPLVKSERYLDKDGHALNGFCIYYNRNGWLDSTSMYLRGKKNGDCWKFRGDSFKIVMKYVYRDDALVETIDITKQKKDSGITYKDEKESEFPGGAGQWLRYLNKNLKYPDRAISANKDGDVSVVFTVDTEGQILDPYIARSVEYSLDEESLRIIKRSGKWTPGFQNGKYVKTYKIQPVNFRLQ